LLEELELREELEKSEGVEKGRDTHEELLEEN